MMARHILEFIALSAFFSGLLTQVSCIKTVDKHIINADKLVTWNIYFEGDKFWSTKVAHIGACAVLCVRMTKCLSFNFDLSTLVCEMNSDILTDTDQRGRWNRDSVYSSIKDWPEETDPECHHRLCQEDEVCIPTQIAEYIASSSRCLKARRRVHCEEGWVFHGIFCYFFSTDKMNWTQAAEKCKSKVSNLVTIENEYEDRFVSHTLKQRHGDDQTSHYFMNGNDLEEEATWVWGYPGGEEMTYRNWHTGEPNGDNNSQNDEDCAALFGLVNYQWVDIGCDWDLYYICKKPMV